MREILGVDSVALARFFAIHEMGHALFFLSDPDLPQPLRVTLESSGDADASVTFDCKLQGTLWSLDQIEGIAAGLLAGGLAVEHFTGENGCSAEVVALGSAADVRDLAQLLAANRDRGPDDSALISRAVKRARAFIVEHDYVISHFAEQLLECGEFDAARVKVIRAAFLAAQEASAASWEKLLALVSQTFQEARTRDEVEWARRGWGPLSRAGVEQARKRPMPARRFGRA
jgi:hypothetical protein